MDLGEVVSEGVVLETLQVKLSCHTNHNIAARKGGGTHKSNDQNRQLRPEHGVNTYTSPWLGGTDCMVPYIICGLWGRVFYMDVLAMKAPFK